MTDAWLRTRLDGDPEGCTAAAESLSVVVARLRSAGELTADLPRATPTWQGRASRTWQAQVHRAGADLSEVADRLDMLRSCLADLGGGLPKVGLELARAREIGRSHGLTVDLDGIHHPASTGVAEPGALAAWDSVCRIVESAREAEGRLHEGVRQRLAAVLADSWSQQLAGEVLPLPPAGGDALDYGAWAVGLPGTVYGVLHVRPVADQLRKVVDAVPARTAWALADADHLLRRTSRVTGPAGEVVGAALVWRDQWRADSDDPALGRVDRIGRAGVRAGLEGGTALAGGIAGGQIGASIGTLVLPGVGTAVGGAVGAGVGSLLATKAGEQAIDTAVEGVDDVVDAAEEVADAAEEVGDRLCFWD